MAVYVDSLFEAHVKNFEGYQWCHMKADTIEELHQFAALIERKRCWYERDHYDLTPSFRSIAIAQGAIEITSRQMCELRRRQNVKDKPVK